MPLVISGKAEHEIARALAHVTLQPFRRGARRAREARLTLLQEIRALSVIRREKTVDALLGLVRVIVDCKRQVDRGLQLSRIASGFARNRLHLPPLLAPSLRVRSCGKPTIEILTGAFERGGYRTAAPDRRSAGLMRCRPDDAFVDVPATFPVDRLPGPQRLAETHAFHQRADTLLERHTGR